MHKAIPSLVALLESKGLPYVIDDHGRVLQIPAGGEGDPLDSFAPSAPAPSAPASPASPAPSYAPPSSASAPAAVSTPAPSAPALDGPQLMSMLSQQLGIPADELRESLDLTRRMRAEHMRRQEMEHRSSPDYQDRSRRNAALDQLLVDRYGPDVASALPALPQLADALHAQRAEGAQADMLTALAKAGMSFGDGPGAQEALTELEDRFTDQINASQRLVRLYNGTPTERRACIQELVDREEQYVNRHLLRQNAATLRDHAARAASQPRGGRSVTVTPRVRAEQPTATDPLLRRREGNQIAGRQLDDIYAHYN